MKKSIKHTSNSATFILSRGDFQQALAKYVETKDHCNDQQRLIDLALRIVITSVHLGTLTHVKTEASRALNLIQQAKRAEQQRAAQQGGVGGGASVGASSSSSSKTLSVPAATIGKFKAALGLFYLRQHNYLAAAQHFYDVDYAMAEQFPQVASGRDIALYGGICALAECHRREIQSRLLENNNFTSFLELAPEMRQILTDFQNSRYASCFEALQGLRPDMALDLFLGPHVDGLLKKIRAKALVTYFCRLVRWI
eukprot:GABV01000354.1.p1 GENE.GABV01000354.1~~GABV01000354.1.p1  ORF type:complete len:254 (+),score=91.05 GABV01000354.1:403-1164(+)